MRLERIIEFARHRREEGSWEALGPDDDRWNPVIVFAREGKTISTVFLPQQVRDEVLHCAMIGVRGYGADEVVVILDGHCAYGDNMGDIKEIEEEMSGGEMQRECEENAGVHRDGVTDLLIVTHAKKGEPIQLHSYPYRVDYNEGKLEWTDDIIPNLSEINTAEGYIPDTFRRIFSMQSLQDYITNPDEPVGQLLMSLLRQVTAEADVNRYDYVVETVSQYFIENHDATVVGANDDRDPHEDK